MRNKIDWKRPEWTAAFVAGIAGIAIHMFGLVNILHNHDDIVVQPSGFGTGLSSGRWFLECLGKLNEKLFGGYNLPWLNGTMVPCAPLVLLEELPALDSRVDWLRRLLTYAAAVAALLIVICNSYMANWNYSVSYYANEQTKNCLSSLVTQARMAEGYDTQKKWAVIGTLDDGNLHNVWQKVPMYDGNMHSRGLLTSYAWRDWIYHHCGYSFAWSDAEETEKLRESEAVKAMPCWPDAGAIKVIGEYVVIKFSE